MKPRKSMLPPQASRSVTGPAVSRRRSPVSDTSKKSRGVRKHTWSIVSLSSPNSFIASCTRGTMK